MEEKTIWKGSSSQVVNGGTYALCILASVIIVAAAIVLHQSLVAVLLVVPLSFAVWKWIENQCRIYEVTTQRIRITTGVLTKKTDELELYRVKDTAMVEPLAFRLFGAGNIVLNTNDQSTPTLAIVAVRNVSALREEIRKNVEICRDQKRVRLSELE